MVCYVSGSFFLLPSILWIFQIKGQHSFTCYYHSIVKKLFFIFSVNDQIELNQMFPGINKNNLLKAQQNKFHNINCNCNCGINWINLIGKYCLTNGTAVVLKFLTFYWSSLFLYHALSWSRMQAQRIVTNLQWCIISSYASISSPNTPLIMSRADLSIYYR